MAGVNGIADSSCTVRNVRGRGDVCTGRGMYGLMYVQGEVYGGVWYVRSESEECKVRNVRNGTGVR